jgi:TolB-like protein
MPDHTPTPGGVFLSYAREDTDAARRIADALRAFGVEVWFDQSELRGGDAWDAKIKRQIRECALFVPIVSARTQARGEGYFRREWKIAVERTHDMAAGVAFIVPLVIDDTPESSALVPDEFMRYQWTRLLHGIPSPQFVEQVKRLLSREPGAKSKELEAGRPRPAIAARGEVAASPKKLAIPGWTWGALTAVVVGVATALFVSHKPEPAPAPAPVVATAPATSPAPAPAAAAKVSAKSIAVLPFANFSPDKENEFFTDGMHDEVITALAKIHDLTVISRTSVMAYKNPEGRNLKKIAAELGVATVLEGSVQRAGNRVKVIVQLIDARTDQHLWAETYTEDVTDVFTIQGKLAGAITAALKATLSPEEKSLLARRPTENQEAYDLYLRGRALGEVVNSGDITREKLDEVVALYEQAIAKDPNFTMAYVQLVATHGVQYWFGHLDPTPARRARAKAALDAALRLAPDSPETRLALGTYSYTCENDWARALAEFRDAEAGLPNDAQLIYFIGLAQRRLGQLPESLLAFDRAAELNPRDTNITVQNILTLSALRRYPAVRAITEHYIPLVPGNMVLPLYLALVRLELDHDRTAFFRRMAAVPAQGVDPFGLVKAYRLAMWNGDLAAAARALADPRVDFVQGVSGIINDPIALHRARVAFLQGRRDEARAFADQAVAVFQAGQWAPRQEASVMLGTAQAHALAGREELALRLASDGFALQLSRDAFAAKDLRIELAHIYLILDRRDDAFAQLREMMTGPCIFGPESIRLDPFWIRVKDDPRFEQILQLAKPL